MFHTSSQDLVTNFSSLIYQIELIVGMKPIIASIVDNVISNMPDFSHIIWTLNETVEENYGKELGSDNKFSTQHVLLRWKHTRAELER